MSTCAVLAIFGSQLKGYISLIENYHQWILFFHHKVDSHFCDEQGPFVTIHIPGLHWVKCFICNAVLATKCTNTWSLIIAYIILHVISMIFQITEYLFMPTYFIMFFGMTVYVNISVIYARIQADPSRPTYPLCVPTAWGILISRLNCLLWSQAHMYFNSLRSSDRMAAKFWSSLLQPIACPQYGAKWVPEPIVT